MKRISYDQLTAFINEYIELDKERRHLNVSGSFDRVTIYRLLIGLLGFGDIITVRNTLQSMIITEELDLDDSDTLDDMDVQESAPNL